MIPGHKKRFQMNTRTGVLLAAGLVFLLLVLFAPFLHNHPIGQPEGPNCPAFLIHTTLIPLLTLLVGFHLLLLEAGTRPVFLQRSPGAQESFHPARPRSPPSL